MTADPYGIGAIQYRDEPIELNPGRERMDIHVRHCGDRPIQVGSHYHFFEVNKALEFDRIKAFGMHLDIVSGTAIRFEPGEEKDVKLVAYGGSGHLIGFNGLTTGDRNDPTIREAAFARARSQGYLK
jgi:urease subunit beta